MRTLLIAIACGAALIGCPKSEPTAGEAPKATAEAGASGEAGASTGAEAAAPKPATVTFTGKYTVTAGTMYVPAQKDWASVKFKNDESKMLGEGELTLAIDPSGRVSGTTESGPLGASVLDGHSDNGTLTATVRRKDPSDDGLTGTLVATVAGDALSGTMSLAESNAAVVRVAKLEAKKK